MKLSGGLQCSVCEQSFSSYLSFLRSPIGTGLTEIRGKVEMEPCDWLLANEDVSRLSGDCGGVMRLGLLHSECEREPGFRGRIRQIKMTFKSHIKT